jgi:hypothetical protein
VYECDLKEEDLMKGWDKDSEFEFCGFWKWVEILIFEEIQRLDNLQEKNKFIRLDSWVFSISGLAIFYPLLGVGENSVLRRIILEFGERE